MTVTRRHRDDVDDWPSLWPTPKAGRVNSRLTRVLPELPAWHAEAACAGRAPLHDAKFGDETTAAWEARYREARAVCATCPVARQCAAYADENKLSGVWAGQVRGADRGPLRSECPSDYITHHPYLIDRPESETA